MKQKPWLGFLETKDKRRKRKGVNEKTNDKKHKTKGKKVMERKNDLCERLFEFAVEVIEFLKTLRYSPEKKQSELNYQKVLVLQEPIMKNLNPALQKQIS